MNDVGIQRALSACSLIYTTSSIESDLFILNRTKQASLSHVSLQIIRLVKIVSCQFSSFHYLCFTLLNVLYVDFVSAQHFSS